MVDLPISHVQPVHAFYELAFNMNDELFGGVAELFERRRSLDSPHLLERVAVQPTQARLHGLYRIGLSLRPLIPAVCLNAFPLNVERQGFGFLCGRRDLALKTPA